MAALIRFGKATLYALPYLLLLIAIGCGFDFIFEGAGRLYLWIFQDHFQLYANHADVVQEDMVAGWWAFVFAVPPLLMTIRSKRRARTVCLSYFLFVASLFALFAFMVKVHGFVSYDEFIQHRGA